MLCVAASSLDPQAPFAVSIEEKVICKHLPFFALCSSPSFDGNLFQGHVVWEKCDNKTSCGK